ncbi:Quinol monooxygenase YgiN [Pedobacter antarcticus]|nr:Quinol monooxygenase YgiN [Pedobacter antarcticus]
MNKFIKCFLIFCLILNATVMNAQNKTDVPTFLNDQEKSLVRISALTAVGDLEQLTAQLNVGMDSGLKVNEIKELLVQLYAYCGFPRSLNGINTFMNVLSDRKTKGIIDKQGIAGKVPDSNNDKYEEGRKVLEILTKSTQVKPAPGFGEFAPRIDAFLKEHLFADIFESDVLNFKQRELVTIAALTAMTGVEAQLKSHVGMGINTGITEDQLAEVADLIQKTINITQANTLRKVLSRPEHPIAASDMLVRISEIEIIPEYLEAYNTILKEEAAASVKVEPGVIAIFPMYVIENPNQIRIIEIYANKQAYLSHLETAHFKLYKTGTLKMVKSLKLVDMNSIDPETMKLIFSKMGK